MSIIPDCRNDETYNEKYLNDTDAEFIAGFDWCRINAVENLFDNIEAFECELEDMEADTEEEQAMLDYFEEHPEAAEAAEKIFLDNMLHCMEIYIEGERDELITSMIENMSDSEYEKIKAEVDAGKRQNCLFTYAFEREDRED